jgi:hypothetical protein
MGDTNPYEDIDGEEEMTPGIEPEFEDEDEKDTY